jgi:glycine/D-amino acid oxidase-like deaminating enzyme
MAMSNRVEHVTIVGGGTAGWLTALILNAHLNKDTTRKRIKVTLIESPKVPTIGVGESTIANLKLTLQGIGMDEADFIRRSNASFKLGVHYIDWSRGNYRISRRYFNTLNQEPACGGFSPAYHFRKFGPHRRGASYGETVMPNAAVIAAGKGPRRLGGSNYTAEINYAYHVDAALFADYMRDFAVARGIEHVRDDVVDVRLDQGGAIEALQLDQRGLYPVEFVVDCTGFKSLIWSRMGAEPFISVGQRLLNDRAIPFQLPHCNPQAIEPATRVIALGAGWVWRVPLYSRLGTGYVYSSAFRSDDEAQAEFIAHLRASGDLAGDAPDPETRVIKMRVGYTRQPWIKNCVAIGLSSGFVEPLESTAIFAIDAAAHRLVMNFPDKQFSPALAKEYNALSTALMEEIVDFLQLNYITSERDEPYWVAVRDEARLSEWLRHKLEVWRVRIPDLNDTYSHVLFSYHLYINLLLSKGYLDNVRFALEDAVRSEDWIRYGQNVRAQEAQQLGTLPSHYDLLTSIRAGSSMARWEPPSVAAAGRRDPLAALRIQS